MSHGRWNGATVMYVRICVTPSSMFSVCTPYSVCIYMYVRCIRKSSPLFAFSGALLVAKKMPPSLSGEKSRQHPAPNLWHLVWLAVVACFWCLIGRVDLMYTAVLKTRTYGGTYIHTYYSIRGTECKYNTEYVIIHECM